MKSFLKFITPLLVLSLSAISCSTTKKDSMSLPSLKSAYKSDFLIGTALGTSHIQERDSLANQLIITQFNAITPENIMKSEEIHPTWNKYNFDLSDQYVAYGLKNKMDVFGHTLIWHSQLSPFARRLEKDSLQLFMKEHISTVVGRYKGKIKGWDVVNEALNEDGTMRKSVFYDKLGDDFIAQAFILANQADPNAELYYNDYNIEQPNKRKGVIEIIKKLKAKGVRIDGIGIQGHWSINGLPLQDIENSIIEFSKLGMKVMFTELDITALPNPWDLVGAEVSQNFEGSEKMNPYTAGLPDSMQLKLANEYESLFKLFVKYKEDITRVTFWGVNDGHTWLNGWPIRNRTNHPLLFDRKNQPKPAYFKVMKVKDPNFDKKQLVP
ncbi:MAG: endo-1,4-beta-xylanase [Saprospiraceae bacterium]|nr:endo-1,4-beta-xylanase [Saprospiraceae bacterium]